MRIALADGILLVHALFILGVVLPVPLIIIGACRNWAWVRSLTLRLVHLGMIAFVVMESLVGMMCPLTVWENTLRMQSGEEAYGNGFIAYWLHRAIFWNLPPSFFTALYCGFGVLVAMLWWKVKPVARPRNY